MYHPGKYLVAWHPKSSTENERTTIVVKGIKNEILVRQIAGAVARRIICYSKVGFIAESKDEIGFIRFGSRVDVFLPLDAEIKCQLNQISLGRITALAEV
jgi:phosphatidylserine decarboxylase